jgi:manganese transport protein
VADGILSFDVAKLLRVQSPASAAAATEPTAAESPVVTVPSHLQRVQARGRLRGTLAILGPAFVACIAYVDPGNFATNIAGGAKYGYLLLWVLLAANLMAMLIQNLSAKIGIATGRNLPELCREHFGRPLVWGLWVQAELIAMATDLAEFIGAAIALNLLFGIPLFHAGLITAVVAFAILGLQARGYRRFEVAIAGMLAVILLGFLYDTLRIGFDPGDAASGFIPGFQGTDSVLLATAILGATVMPHVIYLHSALTQHRIPTRDDGERRALLRFQRLDVTIAMSLAGLVNMSMLIIAASLFHDAGLTGLDSIEEAHTQFGALAGTGAALAFALALLASGLASSSVGTYAGQVVMQGFIARRIPMVLRRAVTMAPALVVLAVGLDPSRSLVISQVVLSFGIPFALVPLVVLTRRRDVMGTLVNRPVTTATAAVVAALIIGLNGFLLFETFLG